MKWIILVICLAALALADGDVVVLTDNTFDQVIKENHAVMVKFFAPWCGHCKALAPEYEKAAKIAKEKGKKYVLAELDATVQTKVAARFAIHGYPTLKLFIDGTPINYEGERKTDPILAYIEKKILPPSVELKTVADIKANVDAKGRRVCLHPR